MSLTIEHSVQENALTAPEILTQMPATPLSDVVDAACRRIAPLWSLKNFVAVNPFVGLSDRAFVETCALMQRVAPGGMQMPLEHYAAQWSEGKITAGDLQSALELARQTLPAEAAFALKNFSVPSLLEALRDENAPATRICSVADLLDAEFGTLWAPFVVDEVSKWCAAYYDEGQASWRMPWRAQPLFVAWKSATQSDANAEAMGLRGFREVVRQLPDDALTAIGWALQNLGVSRRAAPDFLHRQLMSIAGWSGFVQHHAHEKALHGKSDDTLHHLLAIRLAYEVALLRQHEAKLGAAWAGNLDALGEAEFSPAILSGYLWQLAAECAYQRQLLAGLAKPITATNASSPKTRPAVQAVFCIDVRSEPFRRALEAQAPGIETIGFAGFFGFAIEYVPFGARHGAAQCPVLLAPQFRIREALPSASFARSETALQEHFFRKRLARAWNTFKTSSISCFSFVETGGLLSGAKLFKDSLHLPHKEHSHALAPCVQRDEHAHKTPHGHDHSHLYDGGMSLEEQVNTAANALKNMGLTQNFARLVMICGHGSSTTNNPYAAGLDCGACGGHSGQANARVAAAVFNNPQVRSGLKARGINIPEDTVFVPALHNTTTDDVSLFDTEFAPSSHQQALYHLQEWLSAAGAQTRRARAASLGLENAPEHKLDALVRARSLDWAQVRPEWGLAGNAAFIAAPRARTQTLNLGGRSFLHNYDFRSDDGSILELIMTAPMVVASWINLQYFGSTVNNEQFGSGNKTLHNVVGTLGVWQGNAGDLQPGLPLQSLHDGTKWMHEPLRLTVIIEAPRAMLATVIEKHETVRHLLDNNWLHLIALEDDRPFRYIGDLRWKAAE